MTQKQELLIGLTTNNVQELVDNLVQANLTLNNVCTQRENDFLSTLTPEETTSITSNGTVDEDLLIELLETKQFVAPEPEPEYSPYSSAQEKINVESRSYLASTDWYITRFTETDLVVPQDILDLRAEARSAIVE